MKIRRTLTILLFVISCKSNNKLELPEYIDRDMDSIEITISLDDFGDFTSWVYCQYENKSQSKLAILNNALHSIDIYDLELLTLERRLHIEEIGPLGLSAIESLDYENNKLYLFSSVERKILEIDEHDNVKSINIRNIDFKDRRSSNEIFINISPEFSSNPLVLDSLIYFPVGNQKDYASEAFYVGKSIGIFDIFKNEGVSAFGKWSPNYFGKNMYFGSLGEISVSKNEYGIYLSYPIDPIISHYDRNGGKLVDAYFASSSFPHQQQGLSREENDLQAEDHFMISAPWFLKTIYHPNKKALIRFEKQKQDLTDLDGKLNSKLYGNWNLLVGYEKDNFKLIEVTKLPEKLIFIPISFPYKDGILIKKLDENEENMATFLYIKI
jgi:hypothetical protein